jgi:hypothetical protein
MVSPLRASSMPHHERSQTRTVGTRHGCTHVTRS